MTSPDPGTDTPTSTDPDADVSDAGKVATRDAPRSDRGVRHLVSGASVGMRLWDRERPDEDKRTSIREYETVGFVISGRAELELDGITIDLGPGDSWVVPAGSSHRYHIIEPFTAVEATHPPAV